MRDIVQPTFTEIIQPGRVPGIVVAVAHGQQPAEQIALGTDAANQPLSADSLFPVASITKLATALAVLRLVDAGELALDGLLQTYLPHVAAAQDGVTLRRLLSHTSGLPVEVPNDAAPYTADLTWRALAEACLMTPLEAPPMTRVQYSNVGYGLLALVVERVSGSEFAVALASLVLEPLGIEGYLGAEPPRAPVVLADIRGPHAGTALEPFNSRFWRSLALPWAGLITTVDGALRLVRAFYGTPDDFLTPGTRTAATTNQAGALAGGFQAPMIWPACPWGLGPEIRDAKTPHWAPEQASPDSFGHSGASGCLAWVDPRADVAWAMLGTRTADNGWLLRRAPALGAAILARYTAR